MYGIAKEFCRLTEDQYLVKGDFVYVDHGFYRIRNFFWPLPLGFIFSLGHIFYFIGIYRILTGQLWVSWIINFWYGTVGGLAATAGVHRLWSHKSYDATVPLRLFLMYGQTMTGQHSIYSWSVGHRLHHKYSDSDADPHNTKRGFFFAHIGWVFRTEHPDIARKEKMYDDSDLLEDPIVRYQHENYYYIYAISSFIVPMAVQMFCAGDNLIDAFLLSYVMRNISVYHDTAFVNSAAHMFGDRPYNGDMEPRENYYVSLAAFGEGYHNYHHSFPWDYKAAEMTAGFNFTSLFIEICAYFGLAYNLRTASKEVIARTKANNVHKTKNGAGLVTKIKQHPSIKSLATWVDSVISHRRNLSDSEN